MNAKRVLYFGLDPTRFKTNGIVTHFPLIETVPLTDDTPLYAHLQKATHLIFTSREAVRYFANAVKRGYRSRPVLAVGKATANKAAEEGFTKIAHPIDETAEGMLPLLRVLTPQDHPFWPHSLLSRRVVAEFLEARGIPFTECSLYTTRTRRHLSLPRLEDFDQLVFTSPSTVDAFLKIFPEFPSKAVLTSIGPVTKQKLISRGCPPQNPSSPHPRIPPRI